MKQQDLELCVVMPLGIVTGFAAAGLGVSSWVLLTPLLLVNLKWELFDALFLVCCMDTVGSTILGCIYAYNKRVWKNWKWLLAFCVQSAVVVTAFVAALHQVWIDNDDIFKIGSGLLSIVLGVGLGIAGTRDIVIWFRSRNSSSSINSDATPLIPETPITPPIEGSEKISQEPQFLFFQRWQFKRTAVKYLMLLSGMFVSATLVGMLGWGSGTVTVFILLANLDMDIRTATGTATIVMAFSSGLFGVNIACWQLIHPEDHWQTLLAGIGCQILGVVLGVAIVLKIKQFLLKSFLGVLILAIGILAILSVYAVADDDSSASSSDWMYSSVA